MIYPYHHLEQISELQENSKRTWQLFKKIQNGSFAASSS